MKSSVFILFMTLITASLFAQAPNTLWTKTYGDSIHDEVGLSIQQTSDGGYIITGYKRSVDPPYDSNVLLIKTNSYGDTLWSRTYGGGWDYRGYSVQQCADEGYIIAAGIDSNNVGLIKTDANGHTLWSKTFNGARGGTSVQQTSDKGYIVCGQWKGDLSLIKTDTNGDTMWTKTFGDSLSKDWGNSVQQTNDGGYIITGVTKFRGAWPGTGSYAWLLKTDANGDTLWTKTFIGGSFIHEGNSVQQTADGGYIVCGSKDFAVWLIKTDAKGDTLWTKTFGGERGISAQQTNGGGYIVIGTIGLYGNDVWLLKTDGNGDTLWTKTFGDSNYIDFGNSVRQTNDGGYIVIGAIGRSVDPTPVADLWLIKVAPDITSIDENSQSINTSYQLHQNYPNPFNPITTIRYRIRTKSLVHLSIYDIAGREVKTLVHENQNVGEHSVTLNASDLASGVYIYRLKARNFEQSRKMVILR